MTTSGGVPCTLMRGGTSKGAYFLADDLPGDDAERDDLLLRIMGSPDRRQIDGLGGAHPLTSKVAILSPSEDPDVDVEYLFLQVGVDEPTVTDRQNCGNLLAGVGPFAIEQGLVRAADPVTEVRIFMANTRSRATAVVETPGGVVRYTGATAISGVPGTAAPVRVYLEDLEGSTCGALFPTGEVLDVIDGTAATCIDNGMPVVIISAEDVGVTGKETCAELEADGALRDRLERLRLAAGPLMHLGDVSQLSIPKLALVAPPAAGGALATRMFIPHRCHDAIGVLAAVSVATACVIPGTVASSMVSATLDQPLSLEHPTGAFEVVLDLDGTSRGPGLPRAGVLRTCRKIFDGTVYPRAASDLP
jgi:4-oxalomesaconate tautomerase